ncbi:MAG: hypothetical protein CM1200mP38_5220 [Dehalococcoidia bacterium]|nr:MAG: hypothetical protein CM1200mP38_5220 [Dehalococcoidia bacterium]
MSDPELSMTFKEIAAELNNSGGPISASANVMPSGVGGAYSVQICDVEVDKETGKVTIQRVDCHSRCRTSGSSKLCRGTNAGRSCSGDRMGFA